MDITNKISWRSKHIRYPRYEPNLEQSIRGYNSDYTTKLYTHIYTKPFRLELGVIRHKMCGAVDPVIIELVFPPA
jgi:hypothetical protein